MKILLWVLVVMLAVESLISNNQSALIAGLILSIIGIYLERKTQ